MINKFVNAEQNGKWHNEQTKGKTQVQIVLGKPVKTQENVITI